MEIVESDLSQLEPGDFVVVVWLDASRSEHVDINHLPLPNHVIETRRRDPRIFVCVQEGEEFGDPHVVLAADEVDSPSNTVIDVIPVFMVKRLMKVGKKTPQSVKKASSSNKLMDREFREVQRFPDGVVKYHD